MDGDLYLTDQPKDDCLREVQAFITRGISQYSLDIKMSYYLTSIYGKRQKRNVPVVVKKKRLCSALLMAADVSIMIRWKACKKEAGVWHCLAGTGIIFEQIGPLL